MYQIFFMVSSLQNMFFIVILLLCGRESNNKFKDCALLQKAALSLQKMYYYTTQVTIRDFFLNIAIKLFVVSFGAIPVGFLSPFF